MHTIETMKIGTLESKLIHFHDHGHVTAALDSYSRPIIVAADNLIRLQ